MELGFWRFAQENPDQIAVIEPDGSEISAGQLLASANQLVHGLRALGLAPGDCVATVLPNSVIHLEIFMAIAQAGWYVTPINSHLAPPEMDYILEDCGAKAVIVSSRYSKRCQEALDNSSVPINARFSVGEITGFLPYEELKNGQPTTTPKDRAAGTSMTYTSGTTGQPKGVRRPVVQLDAESVSTRQALFLGLFGIFPQSQHVHLTVAPLYHTAVINFATNHLHLGHTVVLMDKWTPEGTLERIQKHGVTCSHMVPTQLIRLLKLPEETRSQYDISSLSHMIHSAAPCPIEIKKKMLEWWGPVLYEYYAASEGGGTLATPQAWLKKPGTVGNAWPISKVLVLDEERKAVEPGTPGTIWMCMGEHRFEYHQDRAKTEDAWHKGFFSVGDTGYLDEDGFLFLCDRKADMIISGGVNIYPAEIEAVLIGHPKVYDVAVFGIPDDDWGEEVKAVIQPSDESQGDPGLVEELMAFCRDRLASYKQPRSIDLSAELPRDPNGKLYKRRLRDPYWEGRDRNI
jgi:long-chain acyl-CoA synthetase